MSSRALARLRDVQLDVHFAVYTHTDTSLTRGEIRTLPSLSARGDQLSAYFPDSFAAIGKWFRRTARLGRKKATPSSSKYRVPAASFTGLEIPSRKRLAGAKPSACELAHNRGSFFPNSAGSDPRPCRRRPARSPHGCAPNNT